MSRARATGRARLYPVPVDDVALALRRVPRHVRVLGADLGGPDELLVWFSYGPVIGCKPSDVRRALGRVATEVTITDWKRREV